MKKTLIYLMGVLFSFSLMGGASAYYTNSTLCYNFEDSKYEECTHDHVNVNYGWSSVYNNAYYPSTTRLATQTYNKPVTRYVCDYDYYYGNRCYYTTDYVKTYTKVPVYNNYNSYYNSYPNTNYSYLGYNTYNAYNNYAYSNYSNNYSYPYYYSSY